MKSARSTIVALALATILSAGGRAEDMPPLNSPASGEWIAGKFVWADLFTTDPAAAAKFYESLFGWTAQTIARTAPSGAQHPFIVLSNDGRPVAGVALRPGRMQDAARGRWVGFVSVPDVPKALDAAVAGGGKVLFPVKDLPQRGTQAVFIDPQGAELGLIHSSSGDPADYTPDPGDWTWAQLFARDPAGAAEYYRALIGYETFPADRAGALILASGGFSRGSVGPLPDRPKAHPAWLLFVRVADVKAAVSRTAGLGGRVLAAPGADSGEYWKAILADPTGAVIGIVQIEAPAAGEGGP